MGAAGAYDCAVSDGSTLVLGELVEPTGLHRFYRAHQPLAETLVDYWAPDPEWGGAEGSAVVVPAREASAGQTPTRVEALLGASWVSGEAVLLEPGMANPPALHGVFTGPGGLLSTDVLPGTGQDVTLTPVTRRQLREWVEGWCVSRG